MISQAAKAQPTHFAVLTLFPEMVESAAMHSIFKRALQAGLVQLSCIDIRNFSQNKHRQADDYPYGGGAGMVMKAQPIYDAYKHALGAMGTANARVVYLTPAGRCFNQAIAWELAAHKNLVLLAGRYEGVDERVIEEIVTDEISIGDYVLTGGELAALVVIDAVARLLPGVVGKAASLAEESFTTGLLEYPQYTRPEEVLGRKVPEILLSGDHGKIATWRSETALQRTQQRRPDLLRN